MTKSLFTVVLRDSNGQVHEIAVQATGSVAAIYQAKQEFLKVCSSAPTVVGVRR